MNPSNISDLSLNSMLPFKCIGYLTLIVSLVRHYDIKYLPLELWTSRHGFTDNASYFYLPFNGSGLHNRAGQLNPCWFS